MLIYLKKFQKDNLNNNNFFSELEYFNQNLIKDLIKKFQDENLMI